MSLFRLSSAWRTDLGAVRLGSRQRQWLRHEGSLTARIRARCGHFGVRVLRQELGRPHADERAVLGLGLHEWAGLREVLLVADGAPWVYAHSVVARRHARGPWRIFTSMGERPLGAALFADPRIARTPLHFRHIDARHPLYRAAVASAGLDPHRVRQLWARRSLFTRAGHALLVCEVFLPEIYTS